MINKNKFVLLFIQRNKEYVCANEGMFCANEGMFCANEGHVLCKWRHVLCKWRHVLCKIFSWKNSELRIENLKLKYIEK